jgi:hypothetical protein
VRQELGALLDEAFVKVNGIFLDRGTSLCETLDSISAAEASRTPAGGTTSIAGHVAHIAFYLDVMNDYVDGRTIGQIDWKQSWLVRTVDESDWSALRIKLRDYYHAWVGHFDRFPDWNDERRLGGAMAVIVHTAYHIGAIRQIMLAVR